MIITILNVIIDITQINLVYCSDLDDFTNENSDVFREQIMKREVLKNLSLKVQIMIKDLSDSNQIYIINRI